MNSPMISVILPVYNGEDFLERCIDSILNQTEPNLELILVDDGSTDASWAICDRYAREDARVRVLHKPNGGLSHSRNAGIALARGQYLAFVDADDWLEPEMYQRMLRAREEESCDAVACGFRRVYRDRCEPETFEKEATLRHDGIRGLAEDLMKARVFGSVWRWLYAREAVMRCRYDEEVRYGEDLLYNLEFLKHADCIRLIPDVLYNYNKTNENSICARSEYDPDARYTLLLQKQLKLNEYWKFTLDPQEFYRIYVDMMFQFLVRKLEEGGNEKLVERFLTEGFFAGCCRYDANIPLRRRIVCVLIRNRRFRLAVAVRKLEDLVLKLLGR